MNFRQSGQRDDRRRRVMVEDNTGSIEKSGKKKEIGSYSSEAHRDQQTRIVDLIPQRPWVLAALFASAAVGISLLGVLHAKFPSVPVFDLTAPASISVWFSSVAFLLGAAVSLQIYTLRRFKSDDYVGGYRVWLWTAAALAVVSLDITSRLHSVVGAGVGQLAGIDPSMAWIIVYGVVFGAIAARIVVEMRRSMSAVAVGLLGATCYGSSVAVHFGLITTGSELSATIVQAITAVSGHAFVLFTLWTYTRYVYLDAHGCIKSKAKPSTESKRDAKASKNRKPVEIPAEDSTPSLDKAEVEALVELEDELYETARPKNGRKEKRNRQSQDVLSMQDEFMEEDEQLIGKSKGRIKNRKNKNKSRRRAA